MGKVFNNKFDNQLMGEDDFTPVEYDPQYILMVNELKKYYPVNGSFFGGPVGVVKAVDGVSFNIKRGTTMGLVGESSCGKTTVGRTILRLVEKTSGQVLFNGSDVHATSEKEMRELRPKMQIIFQDPYSSLPPRLTIGDIVGEGVKINNIVPRKQRSDYVDEILESCGLQAYHKNRYPHEFSGGQRQRVGIARALAMNPEFIVCDEPVSALDVSIQAQILNLLIKLQKERNLSYLFISHDISVVQHISDNIGVMYLGNLVEYGQNEQIFDNPLHPYTKALLSAVPVPDPDYQIDRVILKGNIPSPANPPAGCKFHERCIYCKDCCRTEPPVSKEVEPGHFAACHLYD